jgi:hypothetical protein
LHPARRVEEIDEQQIMQEATGEKPNIKIQNPNSKIQIPNKSQ